MKRFIAVMVSLFICISFTACSNQERVTSEKQPVLTQSKQADFEIERSADYVATNTEDLFEIADLVIVGKPISNNKVYATNSLIVSESTFKINEIKKGEYSDKKIAVQYYGGEMPIGEYMASLSKEQIEKRGYDKLTASEKKEKNIAMKHSKMSAKTNDKSDYLIFLSYSKEDNRYFVLCDGYGLREVKNEKAFDIDKDSFEDIGF